MKITAAGSCGRRLATLSAFLTPSSFNAANPTTAFVTSQLTAALASQISDAATAVLIANEQAVKDHGLKPRARFHTSVLMTRVHSDRGNGRDTCEAGFEPVWPFSRQSEQSAPAPS